jgi:hypothetical protein
LVRIRHEREHDVEGALSTRSLGVTLGGDRAPSSPRPIKNGGIFVGTFFYAVKLTDAHRQREETGANLMAANVLVLGTIQDAKSDMFVRVVE